MSPDDQHQLDAISDALARLVRRQREFDERLARMEAALNLPAPAAAPAIPRDRAPVAPAAPAEPRPLPAFLTQAPPPPPAPAAPESETERPLESVFGLTWISRIGAITLVLGVAFFFKYAFENHWITETGRVLMGLAAAAAALGFGERQWRGGHATYAHAVSAAGIAFAYLSFWAAFSLYRLIGLTPAFLLMALTTAAAGALALRYQGLVIAVLGLGVGYATPLLLDTGRMPWAVLGYALVLTVGAAYLARRWPVLDALSLAGVATLLITQGPVESGDRLGFTLFELALYAVFCAGRLPAVVGTAQVLAAVAVAWSGGNSAIAFLPLLAVTGAGLVIADRREWEWMPPAALAGFWLGNSVIGRLPSVGTGLLAITAGALLFLAWPVYRARIRGVTLRAGDLTTFATGAALYFGTGYTLLSSGYTAYQGLFAVAVAVVHMSAALCLWLSDRRGAMLAAGAAWVFLVLAAPIQFAGYRVTMAWALEGAALAYIGVRLQDNRAGFGALLVFLMALARLLLVDSWMYPVTAAYSALFNARFLTFAVSAASFWAAAWWLADEVAAPIAYVGGHFVLIWALCLEAAGWAGRTASPDNIASMQSTTISIMLAGYALLLVAGGVARRSTLNRLLGIGLIGFVVLKLYLYDVWFLGLFYRMAAFAVLGILLLATSYLYSRFRAKIESLWRPQ